MRSIVFIAVLSVVSSAFAQDAGDFSPTDVGRKWVYSYRYHASGLTAGWREDTTTIRMAVLAKETAGDTDIVYVSVVDSGFTHIRYLVYEDSSSAQVDSTSELFSSYVDTFYEVNGLMSKGQNGDLRVWPPFCPRSTVPADSCTYLGWTAQYQYTVSGTGSTTQFLSDAGLSHHESTENGNNIYITYYHLMSYDVPSGIRPEIPSGSLSNSGMRTAAGNADASFNILGNRTGNGSVQQYGLELRVINGDIHKLLRTDQ